MVESRELVRQYLTDFKVMQLATATPDGQPWACNVHFYADEQLNLYWISTVEREHSQHIAANPRAAATLLVHENTSAEDWVIGLSVAGSAELLKQVPPAVGQAYVKKHGHRPQLLQEIASGANPHRFYRLAPTKIVLFDNHNFPDNPRQEVKLA